MRPAPRPSAAEDRGGLVLRQLSDEEIDARARALADAKVHEAEERQAAIDAAARRAAEAERVAKEQAEAARRQAEEDARHKAEEAVRARAEETARRRFGEDEQKPAPSQGARAGAVPPGPGQARSAPSEDDERRGAARPHQDPAPRPIPSRPGGSATIAAAAS